ncbi:MAG: hypothetical protein AAGI46_07585 [Planctomycetota bacterium]
MLTQVLRRSRHPLTVFAKVNDILRQIDELSELGREFVRKRLKQKLEQEWQAAAAEMRTKAEVEGVDQRVIDEAVEQTRYGKVVPAAEQAR